MQKDKTLFPRVPGGVLREYFSQNLTESYKNKEQIDRGPFLGKNPPIQIKEFLINEELTERLHLLSQYGEATIFHTLLSALNVLFYKYNSKEEITVGIPFSDLQKKVMEKPGVAHRGFIATRKNLNAENSFIELLKEIKETFLEEREHDSRLYKAAEDTIVNAKDLKADKISLIMLAVETIKNPSFLQFGILQLSEKPLALNLSKPEINFFIRETLTGLGVIIEYDKHLYRDERIERMANHFKELLVSITESPNEKIPKLNIIPTEEKQQLLKEFNNTKIAYPRDKSIVDLFEEQVVKNPDNVAVVFEKEELTYGELNKRCNQLSHYLISHGVKKETLVPICIERSLEMLIGILGILKAGACYVPIDSEYPAERISYMLKDTAAKVIISSKKSRTKLPSSAHIDIIEIDGHRHTINNMSAKDPGIGIDSSNLAYVIYTSGSTGQPKGVLIEHQAVADHCFGLIKVARLDTCTSFALFSPLVFDAGHSIIFTSIFLGASLNILSKQLIMDGEKLVAYLEKNPVDCIKIVPSVWLSYINGANAVLAKRVMIFGGETFSGKIHEHLIKLNYKGIVYNHYGPTETTIGKCIHEVDLKKIYRTVPIGKPFSNTQLYVVDQWDQIVPIGIEGELYIGGEGIARGYLNRPDLSAEKFVENPFNADNKIDIYDATGTKPVSKIYKTGDKVKWNEDGDIEYLGRIDEQVKINGHRIELGEIENILLKNKEIKNAAVQVSEDAYGNKFLIGYIVPEEFFHKQKIIAELRKKLPEYMIPGLWVELGHLPLTPNGKIDKKSLPVPDVSYLLNNQYAAPTNDIEAALVKMWQNLLGVKQVGIYDTFFELGGNSIQAVAMFEKIRKHFGREMPLATILEAPNVAKLSAILSQKEIATSLKSLVPIQPKGANTPLFCIHAGAGNIIFYKDLAKNLGNDQPLYALRPRGLNGKEPFHSCIEDMATHYIREIRSIQPNGPYFLAGYCFGGTIAFEMAQQILKEGDKVELIALFNSRPSSYRNSPPQDIDNKTVQKKRPSLISVIFASAGRFSTLQPKEKIVYPLTIATNGLRIIYRILSAKTLNKLLRLEARIMGVGFEYYMSRGLLLPRLLRIRYLLHTNGSMAKAYKPKPYGGKILIFRSPQIFRDPYLGWKNYATGDVKCFNVPGKYRNRTEIMKEPFVKILSERLKTFLGHQ